MKKLFMILLLVPASVFALDPAGGSDGGGGNGVVCYDNANPQNFSVELLDLYEGKQLEGLKIPVNNSAPFMDQFISVMNKTDSTFAPTIKATGESLQRGFRFLGKGVRLKPIDDSNEIMIPANCKVEQLVNFQGPSRIFVVSDFWEKLPENHKAALILHETLWYMERSAGAKSSARARRTVAQFFAEDFKFVPVAFDTSKADYQCFTSGYPGPLGLPMTRFTLTKNSDESCKLNFESLNGAVVFSQLTGELESCSTFVSPTEDTFSIEQTFDIYSGAAVDGERISVTHNLSLGLNVDPIENGYRFSRYVKIENLEFPNYDQGPLELFCSSTKK